MALVPNPNSSRKKLTVSHPVKKIRLLKHQKFCCSIQKNLSLILILKQLNPVLLHQLNSFNIDSEIKHPIYNLVFQVTSFLKLFGLKCFINVLIYPCVLRISPNVFLVFDQSIKYLVKNTDIEISPHVFSWCDSINLKTHFHWDRSIWRIFI
jgi:hypothetical protein